jgi:hypothetical protein
LAVIDSLASPGDLVFDAFSGTLAVSASLQRAGYQVATNDINHFSWTYANAYFSVSELPWPDAPKGRLAATKRLAWQSLIDELISPYTCGIPERARRSDIFNHWGDFKSDAPERTGRAVIEDLFSAPPFVSRNSKCIPVRRMNYQSYGGYSAREVNEFIFVGEKATPCR